MGEWLTANWYSLLQTTSVVAGLFFTAYTVRADTNERRIQNLFTLTSAHREIWSRIYDQPELARVWKTDVDLETTPVTLHERVFVRSIILHLATAFKAHEYGMRTDDGTAADVRQYFRRPIPRAIWNEYKQFQNPTFVAFVEEHI